MLFLSKKNYENPLFYFEPNHFVSTETEKFKRMGQLQETRLLKRLQRREVRNRTKQINVIN